FLRSVRQPLLLLLLLSTNYATPDTLKQRGCSDLLSLVCRSDVDDPSTAGASALSCLNALIGQTDRKPPLLADVLEQTSQVRGSLPHPVFDHLGVSESLQSVQFEELLTGLVKVRQSSGDEGPSLLLTHVRKTRIGVGTSRCTSLPDIFLRDCRRTSALSSCTALYVITSLVDSIGKALGSHRSLPQCSAVGRSRGVVLCVGDSVLLTSSGIDDLATDIHTTKQR